MIYKLCLISFCPVTVLTYVYQTAQCYIPAGKHVTAVRTSDLDHKQMTPDLFTDTLTIKLLTHTTNRYLNLQSHINQILAEISRTS